MGMSASQVRFLSLQSRKHSITNQLAKLSNRKMALSRDMNTVAMRYTQALNEKLLKWSNDSGSNYSTLTYDLLMRPNDLSFEKPYIVTKASTGEVVLNNDELNLEQYGLTPNEDHLTYQKLASYISSFSGVDSQGNVIYKNGGNVKTDTAGKVVGGGQAIDNAFTVPNNKDFSFNENLRYDLYVKMGLITQDDYDKQVNCLIGLYGSKEAKDTGIYPVGSAWGDYYIAQGNLEAYDNYLASSHEIAHSNVAKDSQKTEKSYNDPQKNVSNERTEYTYDTDVYNGTSFNGDSGVTYTKQTNNNYGSLTHVDFRGLVTTNADGKYIYGKDRSTVVNDLTNETQDKIYNDNWNIVSTNYDSLFNGASSLSDTTFKTKISKDGMTYTYTTNDILENIISNSHVDFSTVNNQANAKTANEAEILASLKDGTKLEGGLHVNDYNKHCVQGDIKPSIENMVDKFAILLQQNTIVDFSDWGDAIKKAKDATVALCSQDQSSTKCGGNGSKHATLNARSQADNHAVGIGMKHFDVGVVWASRAYTSVCINTQIVFDTFMSFLNAYHNGSGATINPSANSAYIDGPRKSGTTTVTEVIDGVTSEYTEENAIMETTGSKYRASYDSKIYLESSVTGTNSDGDDVTMIERKEMTTNSAEDAFQGDHRGDIYKKVGSDFVALTTLEKASYPGTKYYLKAGGNYESCIYYNSGSKQMYINEANPSANVYGVLNNDNGTYYFTSEAALNEYKNNGKISSTGVIFLSDTASTGSYPVTLEDDARDTVILNNSKNSSKYDIKVDTYVKEDPDYRRKLEKKVQDAADRIKDLEDQMDDAYSGSNKKLMDYYDALFQRIAENGWTVDNNTSSSKSTSTTYLNNKLQNNDYFVTECQSRADYTGYNYTSKMAQNITKIYEVYDNDSASTALADYECEKKEIQAKEDRIDLVMEKLETEQEAITTTMDSVKKIIDNNIKKTFRMFA